MQHLRMSSVTAPDRDVGTMRGRAKSWSPWTWAQKERRSSAGNADRRTVSNWSERRAQMVQKSQERCHSAAACAQMEPQGQHVSVGQVPPVPAGMGQHWCRRPGFVAEESRGRCQSGFDGVGTGPQDRHPSVGFVTSMPNGVVPEWTGQQTSMIAQENWPQNWGNCDGGTIYDHAKSTPVRTRSRETSRSVFKHRSSAPPTQGQSFATWSTRIVPGHYPWAASSTHTTPRTSVATSGIGVASSHTSRFSPSRSTSQPATLIHAPRTRREVVFDRLGSPLAVVFGWSDKVRLRNAGFMRGALLCSAATIIASCATIPCVAVQDRVHYTHLSPLIIFWWRCSLVTCEITFNGQEKLCNFVERKLEGGKYVGHICDDRFGKLQTWDLPNACEGDLISRALLGRTCFPGDTLRMLKRVQLASCISILLIVASCVCTAILIGIVMVNLQRSLEENEYEVRTSGFKLHGEYKKAARVCLIISPSLLFLTTIVYYAIMTPIESSGGFLQQTGLGILFDQSASDAMRPLGGITSSLVFSFIAVVEVLLAVFVWGKIYTTRERTDSDDMIILAHHLPQQPGAIPQYNSLDLAMMRDTSRR